MRSHLRAIVDAALAAVDARRLLERSLAAHPLSIDRPFSVVAAGKAARPMAAAIVAAYGRDNEPMLQGGAGRIREIVIARGSHPTPDQASVESARAALRLAADCRERGERLVVLLSGGASAMLAAPANDLSLADKVAATRLLLQSGVPIADFNAVRKHLSAVKGGRLAAAAGESTTFAISDVHAPVEDDPSVIGSGPTVGDRSTFREALDVVRRSGLHDALPHPVVEHLAEGVHGSREETIRPDDPRLEQSQFILAGSRRDAMHGAGERARALGYHVVVFDEPTLGEAKDAAAAFVARALALSRTAPRSLCVLASGETTVKVTGDGRGGRNQEFALAGVAGLGAFGGGVLASVGTDGIDGPTDAAGAVVDSTTARRAAGLGLDIERALSAHDAYPLFERLNDLIVTGPTETNVGDLQVLLVE